MFLPLDDWLTGPCAAAGVPLVLYDGWQTRARSSGGYDAAGPLAVMWHHTASNPGTSPDAEAVWMCHNSPDRPLANVVVQRDGAVWVLAAGRTNTNGKGGPATFSRGTVPADRMNDYGFGMEIANTGTGEPYPAAVVDAAFVVSNTINRCAGNVPGDVLTHQRWAPTRKIDPATAAAVQGPWRPSSSTSSGTWNLDDLRAEATRRATTPTPPPEDDDMPKAAVYQPNDDPKGPWIWWDGTACGWVRDATWLSVGRDAGVYANGDNNPLKNFTKAQIQQMISSSWADTGPKPPGYG